MVLKLKHTKVYHTVFMYKQCEVYYWKLGLPKVAPVFTAVDAAWYSRVVILLVTVKSFYNATVRRLGHSYNVLGNVCEKDNNCA